MTTVIPEPSIVDNEAIVAHNQDQYDWLALIPTLLTRRGFTCTEQTVDSARSLMEAGLLGNFTQENPHSLLTSQVEASLLESFLEDDYDGALHLTTLDDNSDGRPVGFVFWRQVPEEEMREWIHWENLQKRLQGEQQRQKKENTISEDSDDDDDDDEKDDNDTELPTANNRRRMRQSLRLVRDESVHWLEVASTNASRRDSLAQKPPVKVIEQLADSWVKLELLAVHPDYWGQHIGTLLLACAMYQAYQKGEEHMILHVAGGLENVPALRLYDKFGFLPVPQGTVFHKPDKDLFVLGHVGQSLQRLCWPALEV